MTTYRVELAQTLSEIAVVYVDANNPDEAERLALSQVTTGSGADWKFKDVLDGVEVLSVTTTEQSHESN